MFCRVHIFLKCILCYYTYVTGHNVLQGTHISKNAFFAIICTSLAIMFFRVHIFLKNAFFAIIRTSLAIMCPLLHVKKSCKANCTAGMPNRIKCSLPLTEICSNSKLCHNRIYILCHVCCMLSHFLHFCYKSVWAFMWSKAQVFVLLNNDLTEVKKS